MKNEKQLQFNFRSHGGSREGAGRPKLLIDELSHTARPLVDARVPMHITIKLRQGTPGLREPKFLYAFSKAVKRAASKGLRIQQFSIQSNHLHLVAEVDDNSSLRTGMCSLLASVIWALRKIYGYWGAVFVSRYHVNPIRVPQLMKHVLKYVLFNRDHHCGPAAFSDVYSSVFAFHYARVLVGREPIGVRPRWQPLIEASLSEAQSWM